MKAIDHDDCNIWYGTPTMYIDKVNSRASRIISHIWPISYYHAILSNNMDHIILYRIISKDSYDQDSFISYKLYGDECYLHEMTKTLDILNHKDRSKFNLYKDNAK